MMMNNISLYFHIPFCVKKCDYCAFYSLANQGDEIKERYFNALIKQIEQFDTVNPVSSIYFGGGTPPLLRVERLCKLLSLVKSRFALKDDCEITVEINPKTVDKQDLELLKKSGFNRLSIGVQSSNDRVLKSIGRIHDFAEAKKCISLAREVGFENISGDLIFALPDMSLSEFKQSVYDIMSTGVDHISAYSLQLEEGTPLFERRGALLFPDEDTEEAQYEALCEILAESGYEHYEVSSFAKAGFKSRHNLNYWARGEYFGFGAGAHSYYKGKRFSAVCDIEKFIHGVSVSPFAVTDFENSAEIGVEEAEEERIMLGLRTSDGVLIPEKAAAVAKRIADLGYGSFENGVLRLNSKGFRVSNMIISEILI